MPKILLRTQIEGDEDTQELIFQVIKRSLRRYGKIEFDNIIGSETKIQILEIDITFRPTLIQTINSLHNAIRGEVNELERLIKDFVKAST